MTSDLAVLARVTASLYRESAAKALRGLRVNWLVVPASIGAYFLYNAVSGVLPSFLPGMAGGLALGLFQAFLLSCYYSWLSSTVRNDRLGWGDLMRFDQELFFGVIGIGFLLFISDLVLSQLTAGMDAHVVLLCAQLFIAIVLNPIPEVLYTHRFDGTHAVSHSFKFVRDNWIEWFVPFVLFMAPFFLLGYGALGALGTLTSTDPLLPAAAAVRPWFGLALGGFGSIILAGIFGITVGTWFMLFRGHLFVALDTTSRRRRIFQGRQ